MSITDMIWDYFPHNPYKNLFIHSLGYFKPLPRFRVMLIQVPRPCQTFPNFLGFVPKLS